jgi:hypothetical protein
VFILVNPSNINRTETVTSSRQAKAARSVAAFIGRRLTVRRACVAWGSRTTSTTVMLWPCPCTGANTLWRLRGRIPLIYLRAGPAGTQAPLGIAWPRKKLNGNQTEKTHIYTHTHLHTRARNPPTPTQYYGKSCSVHVYNIWSSYIYIYIYIYIN